VAIGHLADRLRGRRTFCADWPLTNACCRNGERLELQQCWRATLRYRRARRPSRARTRAAIRDFQVRMARFPTACLRGRARPVCGPLAHDPEKWAPGFG